MLSTTLEPSRLANCHIEVAWVREALERYTLHGDGSRPEVQILTVPTRVAWYAGASQDIAWYNTVSAFPTLEVEQAERC